MQEIAPEELRALQDYIAIAAPNDYGYSIEHTKDGYAMVVQNTLATEWANASMDMYWQIASIVVAPDGTVRKNRFGANDYDVPITEVLEQAQRAAGDPSVRRLGWTIAAGLFAAVSLAATAIYFLF